MGCYFLAVVPNVERLSLILTQSYFSGVVERGMQFAFQNELEESKGISREVGWIFLVNAGSPTNLFKPNFISGNFS